MMRFPVTLEHGVDSATQAAAPDRVNRSERTVTTGMTDATVTLVVFAATYGNPHTKKLLLNSRDAIGLILPPFGRPNDVEARHISAKVITHH